MGWNDRNTLALSNSSSISDCSFRQIPKLQNFCSPNIFSVAKSPNCDIVSFSNQSDFLLITKASIEAVARETNLHSELLIYRFRPNFVIDTGPNASPFEEDLFKAISIGGVEFEENFFIFSLKPDQPSNFRWLDCALDVR